MNREELQFALRTLLRSGDRHALARIARATPRADVADALAGHPAEAIASLLLLLEPAPRAELFAYLAEAHQDAVLLALPRSAVVELFERLPADDRADLFNRLDEEARAQLLPALAKVEGDDVLRLAAYPEGSVGSITTSDYAAIGAEMSVAEAMHALRASAPDKETIDVVYVIDDERRLLGTVALRDLVLAAPEARVADLMQRDPILAYADRPREQAAALVSRYDLLALPVIDASGRMIGIVTVDDAMDVARAEATDDIFKGGAIQGHLGGPVGLEGVSVRTASVLRLFRMRVFWLLVLVFGNLFSGAGIAHFEDTIAAYIALVFFLPLLIDSGGNAGSQAATLMVRALATGDVVLTDWMRMLGREFAVAALLGTVMALAVSGVGLVRGGPEIAVVVALAMVAIVIVGSVIGMSLPFVLARARFDPATASAPLVTSIADAAGVVIYLSLAVAILGAPGP
jgi:magnesium transporter